MRENATETRRNEKEDKRNICLERIRENAKETRQTEDGNIRV